jgi:CheY-like chemotaxis protein
MLDNPLKGKKILVVDDEDFLREVLTEILSDAGAETQNAENGHDAFEILKKQHFDAVISDIRMPGGDGITLVENISQSLTDKPKIFLCSGFNDLPPEKAKKLGVVEVFPKPFSSDQLVIRVAEHLNA